MKSALLYSWLERLEAWRRHQPRCSRHTQIFPPCAAYVLETCSHHFPVEQAYLITYVFSAFLVIWRAVSFPRWYRNVDVLKVLDDLPWRKTSVYFALFDAICCLMPFFSQRAAIFTSTAERCRVIALNQRRIISFILRVVTQPDLSRLYLCRPMPELSTTCNVDLQFSTMSPLKTFDS